LQPRPSFQGPLPSDFSSFGPRLLHTKEEASGRWKYDNRLIRTIETMTTGVEKFMGKMGLSRPLRVSTDASNKSASTCGTKRSSVHGTTESNSIGRPYRSKSKRTKRKHSASQMSQLSTASRSSLLPQFHKPELNDINMDERVGEALPFMIPQASPTSPLNIHTLAFPATAGAGARAAVAQHKRSHFNLLDSALTNHSQQNSVITFEIEVKRSETESPDLEIISTQSWADSMDLDSIDDNVIPGTADSFDLSIGCRSLLLDPVKALPTELVWTILSKLDEVSLINASHVSRAWRSHATSNHVWRDFFLSKFTPAKLDRSSYLQIGGLGIGKKERVAQEWRRMAIARIELEKSWERADPAAVYFCGHTDSVYCCQFDEEKIITGSRDRTIRVWDLRTKKCLKVIGGPANKPVAPPANSGSLETHKNTVSSVKSVNGTSYGDSIFYVPSYYHHASILCLQFDNEIMVTGSSDSTCIVWDIKTYEPIAHLRRHTSGVLDVCFDDKYIVSCSKDHTICVWSRKTFELVRILSGHTGPVNAVQMRGNKLVSASGDGMSKLWDLKTFEMERNFPSRDRGLAAVEFSDDGRYVLAGGNDQVIYKYDANTAEVLHVFNGHTNLVRSLFLDCNNRRVLSGSYDQGIRVWNFDTGAEIGTYNNWTTSWILSAKCDYRRIVATSQDGRVLLMDFGYGIDDIHLLSAI
jgi:WD40 repeat protein